MRAPTLALVLALVAQLPAAAQPRLERVLAGHTDWARAIAFAPDGTLASGSKDNSIRLWTDDGRARTLDSHSG